MNDYAWAGQASALFAIVAGILTCFWGYRILKFSLAIIGFIVGAYGGWEIGLSLAHGSTGIALVCAGIGGLIGAVLCLWVYFLGVFLLGATAGGVIAAALFSGTGQQIQPIIFLVLPIGFGVIALLAQKFMIILSTAFSGSYLIMAGVWPFVAGGQNASQVWLHPAQKGPSGTLGYGALALWIVLALVGVSFQFRASRRKVETKTEQK
ncbi:MAG TPA: DUF4203 domain-containing protein [Candidatus Acidoferrum sp.]|jgi:hypothetical protein|nr:DUF4203 domain-containing protein [Candidatus Acidoferrum sp.]